VITAGIFIGINNTRTTQSVMMVSPVERPVASDYPETPKGTGETDHHDIMDSLPPPSGADRADRENGPGQCGTPTRDL